MTQPPCIRRSVPYATPPTAVGNSDMGKKLKSPDFARRRYRRETDAQLTDGITNGKGKKMPAYKSKLTDDQIKDLVAYIRELAKKK